MRFLDQIDADREAHRWLEARALALGANRMEWANHEGCGRTGTAWKNNDLLAVAVVVRDEVNASVLTCHDIKTF